MYSFGSEQQQLYLMRKSMIVKLALKQDAHCMTLSDFVKTQENETERFEHDQTTRVLLR